MKQVLLLYIVCFAAACSNNGKEKPAADTAPATPEQRLKAAVAAYPDSLALRDELIKWYADNESYEAAMAATEATLAKDSNNAYFWNLKANLYGITDDTTNAIKALEKAVALNPLPDYLLSLGYLYADTKNEKALLIGDALLMAEKAKAKKEALLIKGMYFSKLGNTAKALALFDEALAADYTFTFAYREKAITLYNNSRYEAAIETLKKGTTLQNNFDEGYYWMGRCYEKLEKKEEAINEYQKALLYAPGQEYAEATDALSRLGVR